MKKPIILAVDDAPDTLGMLSAMLEAASMTTLVAADGDSALSLLSHVVPDLILMDAIMPRMDGFELTRTIKARAAFAHIPVIFMTGLAEPENVVKGFEAGGVDYITKPIVPEVVLARVKAHLATARLAQSARRALDVSGAPLMAANAAGAVLWITPEGLKLLNEAVDDWRTRLAPVLADIIAGKGDHIALKDIGGGAIFASLVGESQPGEYLLRLKDANAPSETTILKKFFSLTEREAEVLGWLAKGKSNRDVAAILGCSPRTVNKHLEQIYSKLQVENRTAAAMRAIHVLTEN
ncbi:MAG TPA: response regulator [Rhizorhapis sp.]|nr:response regulator [Rhizorhapis sp.]